MTITYATFSEFTQVYSVKGVSEAEISSVWLPHGALRVNEALGGPFATPFSDDNVTARDLSIRFAYLGILVRTHRQDDSAELRDELSRRITDIRRGNTPMITDSGDTLFVSEARNDAWSSTQDFKPTFDMRDAIEQRVDPDLIDDLNNRDN